MKQKKQILFIGRFFPEKLLKTIKDDSYGRIGFSNHNFEMSIISGLRKQPEIELHCLSIPSVYSYPHNNKRFYISSERYTIEDVNVQSVGFCNLFFINNFSVIINTIINVLRNLKSFSGNRVDLIINTPKINLLIAVLISRIISRKNVSLTLIIPDVPMMMTGLDRNNYLKRLILSYTDRFSMYLASKCDYFVLLTDAMTDFFRKPLKYIVMEGLINTDNLDQKSSIKRNDCKIILYTGTLRAIFGVMNLIKAFLKINVQNTELWICGSGDLENEIKDIAHKNSKIKFWGLVDTVTVREMQNNATVLVNPRTSEGIYTKYSFPSKTIEYMLAGKPVIMNRLPGIPNEYYKYVFTPINESVDELTATLNYVLEMKQSDRINFGLKAREFIIKYKNSKYQMAKVLEMINSNT